MSLNDLPVTEFEARASAFLPQMKEDMCYPACLTNVLNDLGRRMKISLKYTLGEMNRLCDYKEGLQCNEPAIPKIIDDQLKPSDYAWNSRSGKGLDIEFLKSICANTSLSRPIVRVGSSFFENKGMSTVGRRKLDHSIIIMGVDTTIVYTYDPYETFYIRGKHKEALRRDMAIPAFLTAWDSSLEPRWVAWASPRSTKQTKLPGNPEDG
jgi:hypothetical protein